MSKDFRQQRIQELIRAHKIGTQDELSEFLERSGVGATQSSISRDLEELGIVKLNGFYTIPRAASGPAARGLLDLMPAGEVLIVAKCELGMASAVAVEIDRRGIPEIIGTVAGDDTIFVAVADHKSQRAAIKKIWEIF